MNESAYLGQREANRESFFALRKTKEGLRRPVIEKDQPNAKERGRGSQEGR